MTTTKQTLHAALVAAGIKTDSHESDLYFPVTPESTAILAQYPTQQAIAEKFKSQIDHTTWYDVPFGYVPFWDKKAR